MLDRVTDHLPKFASGPAAFVSLLRGYVPALCVLAGVTIVHFVFAFSIGIGPAGIFFLYLMAILIAAWCGYGPGLLVLFLAAAVIPYAYVRTSP